MLRLLRRETLDGRHVAEVPMMLLDSVFHCEMKCRVGVVGTLIDAMYQWWPLIRAAGTDTVTSQARTLIDALAQANFSYNVLIR